MTNTIMAIVAALILCEDSGPTERGACGGVGVLQITEIMYREYVRLGGTLPPEGRESAMLSKQMAHFVLTERFRRRGISAETELGEVLRYAAWLWNPADPAYYSRLSERFLTTKKTKYAKGRYE